MEWEMQERELEDQIRECFGRVVYTHKTHMKSAESYHWWLRVISFTQATLSTIAGCSAVAALLQTSKWGAGIAAAVSFLSALVAAYSQHLDPGGTSQKHREVGAKLWNIREWYLSLLTDLRSGAIAGTDARSRRDDLQAQLLAIYETAPPTNNATYLLARKALTQNQEYSFSDAEIDEFLPSTLHKPKGD